MFSFLEAVFKFFYLFTFISSRASSTVIERQFLKFIQIITPKSKKVLSKMK